MKRISLVFIAVFLVYSVSYAQRSIELRGTIQNEKNQLIENVVIVCDVNNSAVISDAGGNFKISIPFEKEISLLFRHVSYYDTVFHINSSYCKDSVFRFVLRSLNQELPEVRVTQLYNDSYTRINPKLSYKLPSPTGGVESLIKTMPGTSSVNELSSQYNVRGGNYDENLIFVNDIQIYRPFLVRSGQQEGLSFVNLDLTKSVKFSAGGFEAKYGDKMSSVLDVEYKTPSKYGGSFTASFLGASRHMRREM